MSESIEEPVAGEERPDYLLDKFDSPEEQARGYAEAEKEMRRMRDEMERERNQFAEALTNLQSIQEPAPQQYSPENDPYLNRYQEALDSGDARAMLAMNLELQRQITQETIQNSMKEFSGTLQQTQDVDREVAITLATEKVARNYEDWDEIAPDVGRILQENQEWIPNRASIDGYEKAISQAARIVLSDRVLNESRRLEAARQEKLNNQGLVGEGSRDMSPEQKAAEWDRIKSINLGGYTGLLGNS
jgi:hypothetical protein